jgi:Domain of unknown function (DUF4494)
MWYQGKIKYQKEEIVTDKQGDRVVFKTITEAYLVDAETYTEAEARLYTEIAANIATANRPDFTVGTISKMKLADVFFRTEPGDSWYKCKVTFFTEDEKTGKEKKLIQQMLINANTLSQAYERLEDSLKTILMPMEITDISKTALLDIFPYPEAVQQ